jgi:hypothetical protein
MFFLGHKIRTYCNLKPKIQTQKLTLHQSSLLILCYLKMGAVLKNT